MSFNSKNQEHKISSGITVEELKRITAMKNNAKSSTNATNTTNTNSNYNHNTINKPNSQSTSPRSVPINTGLSIAELKRLTQLRLSQESKQESENLGRDSLVIEPFDDDVIETSQSKDIYKPNTTKYESSSSSQYKMAEKDSKKDPIDFPAAITMSERRYPGRDSLVIESFDDDGMDFPQTKGYESSSPNKYKKGDNTVDPSGFPVVASMSVQNVMLLRNDYKYCEHRSLDTNRSSSDGSSANSSTARLAEKCANALLDTESNYSGSDSHFGYNSRESSLSGFSDGRFGANSRESSVNFQLENRLISLSREGSDVPSDAASSSDKDAESSHQNNIRNNSIISKIYNIKGDTNTKYKNDKGISDNDSNDTANNHSGQTNLKSGNNIKKIFGDTVELLKSSGFY